MNSGLYRTHAFVLSLHKIYIPVMPNLLGSNEICFATVLTACSFFRHASDLSVTISYSSSQNGYGDATSVTVLTARFLFRAR